MKFISKSGVLKIVKTLLAFLFLIAFSNCLDAQDDKDWKLAGAMTYGYAPKLSFDGSEGTGNLLIFTGDLSYKKIIGRLQYSTLLNNSYNIKTSFSFHGSLGVNVSITENFYVPVMLSGGGSVFTYRASISGIGGSSFTEGSPQAGVTVAPYYQLTKNIGIQSMFRYHKGFTTNDDQTPIDVTDISIGVRLTL